MLSADGGSFKDPSGRVYRWHEPGGARVVRGLNDEAAATIERLLSEPFFRRLVADGDIAKTTFLPRDDPASSRVIEMGWAAAVEHEAVEFVTWPYEWPFSMLKDAALLQLRLLDTSRSERLDAQGRHSVQHPVDRRAAPLHGRAILRSVGGWRVLAGIPAVLFYVPHAAHAHGASRHTLPAAACAPAWTAYRRRTRPNTSTGCGGSSAASCLTSGSRRRRSGGCGVVAPTRRARGPSAGSPG